MQTLEYHLPPKMPSQLGLAVMVSLPAAAPVILFLALLWSCDEPFTQFHRIDFAIFASAPTIVTASLIAWGWMARRRRLRWPIVVPVMGLFLLVDIAALLLLIDYFHEPWNSWL